MRNRVLGLSAASLLLATAAVAETSATATADLNVRSGPNPAFGIVTVIPAEAEASVEGCLETANWCKVTYEGASGWAYGDYLTTKIGDDSAVLYENRQQAQVVTLTYDDTSEESAIAVGSMGAVAGALIGGPPGAAIGAVLGSAAGGMSAPDPEVVTYVTSNPVEPMLLNGEVVVGAGVPDDVTLYPVPETSYSYLYLNGVPVVIENDNRKIVHIVR